MRSRWGEDGGGPWTFVLKVIRSLKLDLSGEFEFVQSLSARMLINPWVGRLRLDVTGRPRGEGDATLTLMSSFGDVWRIQGS